MVKTTAAMKTTTTMEGATAVERAGEAAVESSTEAAAMKPYAPIVAMPSTETD